MKSIVSEQDFAVTLTSEKRGIVAVVFATIIFLVPWALNANSNPAYSFPDPKKHASQVLDAKTAKQWASVVNQDNSSAGPKRVGQMQAFQLARGIKPRPTASWNDSNGNKLSLADFSGKVVMLNFWASWCSPCIRELPSINRLQLRLGGDRFKVITLNMDRGGKPIALRVKRRLKLDQLSLYLDKGSFFAKFMKIRSLPTTIIFDAKGREVGRVERSAEWDSKEALSLLQWFIDNPGHADNLPQHNS